MPDLIGSLRDYVRLPTRTLSVIALVLASTIIVAGLAVWTWLDFSDVKSDAEAIVSTTSLAMGYTAVAALVVSGLINGWYLVGSVSALTGSLYGQLLVTKLCLFGGMLALAALNRFWLVPSLMRENAASQPAVLFIRLRRHVLGEQTIGLIVVFVVSLLGMMQPAISS